MGVVQKGFFNPLRKPTKVTRDEEVSSPAPTSLNAGINENISQNTLSVSKPKITAEEYLKAIGKAPKIEEPAVREEQTYIRPIEQKEFALSAFDKATKEVEPKMNAPKSIAPATSSLNQNLSKQELIDLAKSMGLELAKPKVKWAKHSFEFREETLLTFKKMVRQLGYASIKEATEEMMDEWSQKRIAEYRKRTGQ